MFPTLEDNIQKLGDMYMCWLTSLEACLVLSRLKQFTAWLFILVFNGFFQDFSQLWKDSDRPGIMHTCWELVDFRQQYQFRVFKIVWYFILIKHIYQLLPEVGSYFIVFQQMGWIPVWSQSFAIIALTGYNCNIFFWPGYFRDLLMIQEALVLCSM